MTSMRLRAPVPGDAPAVLAVLAARDLADLGVVDYTLEDLREEWQGSDVELDRDARVAELDGGSIVGYAMVRRPGTLAVVHPEHEGEGIGARLLAWAERRERDRGRETHRQWVAAANERGRELLTRAGYRRVGTYARMARSLGGDSPSRLPPAGYRLRAVDPARDATELHALDAAAFAAAPDYLPGSVQEFTEEHLEAHDFDPALSRVAAVGEEIVGFLLARRWSEEGVGFVDILAVRPDHQGHGVGTALLCGAFTAFAQAGLREAQLGVHSANLKGLRLYEAVGMSARHRTDVYERPVGPAPTRWRSYRHVDAAEDPGRLANHLERIASVGFVAHEKRRALELLELAAGTRVLDVGCGTGPELAWLAAMVGPGGKVVGLERSTALIAAARGRTAARAGGLEPEHAIELVQGDACALPFGDAAFDGCRADRTLQHVEDPDRALAEMIRVVRPGGRVVVSESRWGLVAPALDQATTDGVLARLAGEEAPADWLGHRLPAMFERAGLDTVRSLRADYTASEHGEFFAFTGLDDPPDDAAGRAWLAQLDALVRGGEAFAMVLFLHVAGAKPRE